MNLRQENEQYVGKFFKNERHDSHYLHIFSMDQWGIMDLVKMSPLGIETREAPMLFEGYVEIPRDEFEMAFNLLVNSWRVW